jgi:hypothetical protein
MLAMSTSLSESALANDASLNADIAVEKTAKRGAAAALSAPSDAGRQHPAQLNAKCERNARPSMWRGRHVSGGLYPKHVLSNYDQCRNLDGGSFTHQGPVIGSTSAQWPDFGRTLAY